MQMTTASYIWDVLFVKDEADREYTQQQQKLVSCLCVFYNPEQTGDMFQSVNYD